MARPLFRTSAILVMGVLLLSLGLGTLGVLKTVENASLSGAGCTETVGAQATVLNGTELLAEEVEDAETGTRHLIQCGTLPVCLLPFSTVALSDPSEPVGARTACQEREWAIQPPPPGALLGILRV